MTIRVGKSLGGGTDKDQRESSGGGRDLTGKGEEEGKPDQECARNTPGPRFPPDPWHSLQPLLVPRANHHLLLGPFASTSHRIRR